MKILLNDNPLAPSNRAPADFSSLHRERPAWITARQPKAPPEITAFRLQFDLPQETRIRVHVSADERYLFYVDGQCVGRDPERGSDRAWFYETYDLELASGSHTMVALVWQLGDIGPLAQISLAGGFLLEAEGPYGELLSTKTAKWETRSVSGVSFSMPEVSRRSPYFVQPIQTTDGTAYPWGIEVGEGDGWEPATARLRGCCFPFWHLSCAYTSTCFVA